MERGNKELPSSFLLMKARPKPWTLPVPLSLSQEKSNLEKQKQKQPPLFSFSFYFTVEKAHSIFPWLVLSNLLTETETMKTKMKGGFVPHTQSLTFNTVKTTSTPKSSHIQFYWTHFQQTTKMDIFGYDTFKTNWKKWNTRWSIDSLNKKFWVIHFDRGKPYYSSPTSFWQELDSYFLFWLSEVCCPVHMVQLGLLIRLCPRSSCGHPYSNIAGHSRAHMVWTGHCSRLRRMVHSRELHVWRLCCSCIKGSVASVGWHISGMRCLPRHVVVWSGLHSWMIPWVLNPNLWCLRLKNIRP